MTKAEGSAVEIVVFGVVQGVGFRPFIYRLAHELGYKGWVKNIGYGVEIHIEKDEPSDFEDFCETLRSQGPPLAQIEKIVTKPADYLGLGRFAIEKTKEQKSFVFISPDISVCQNCHGDEIPVRPEIPLSLHQLHRLRPPLHHCQSPPL